MVRLNPNIPWKTRGNGAISFQIGKGNKDKIKIGNIDKKDIFSSKKLLEDVKENDIDKIKKLSIKVVEANSKISDEKTNPGIVFFKNKPDYDVYKNAVTKVIKIKEIKEILNKCNADYQGYKNSRGLIGATSSIAWIPKDRTFEIIVYRKKDKWGLKRYVDDQSVKNIDKKFKSTFDNYDYTNKHNRITPSSPCPILFGVRGNNTDDLIKSLKLIKSEQIDSWIIFETNQGTDEHIQKRKINQINTYESVKVIGEIIENPKTLKGGHVFFTIQDSTGKIDCAAYEPTKEFRNIIRELKIVDKVEVYGGVRKKPLTINLEKIKILKLVKIEEKIENPFCMDCNKHMKSKGKNQGFKCPICGKKSNKSKTEEIKRNVKIGLYEVPICARRHLSKPLKRFDL